MVFILKCDIGTRRHYQDMKVVLKKDNNLVEQWLSKLKPKDTFLWESERTRYFASSGNASRTSFRTQEYSR